MKVSASGRLVLTAAVVTLAYVVCFPHRLKYPAHVVAGIGLGAMVLVGLQHLRLGPGAKVALTLSVVAVAAAISELTITGPEMGWLDVANTTMGGAFAIGATLSTHGERRWPLALTGVALALVGWAIRYPIQSTVKHWWWFGT